MTGVQTCALPICTFAHLETRPEQEAALSCFRRHLAPAGSLVLALQNPYQWALDPAQDEVVFGWEKPGPEIGETTRMSYAVHTDRALQLRHLRLWYDVAASGGVLHRTGAALSQRWTYRPEMELLLEACGFLPEACYGTYDLDSYDADTPLLLVLATRP